MKIIKLTKDEIPALCQLMDAGVKSLGLNCVHNASILLRKLETAEEEKDSTVSGLKKTG